MKNIVPESVVMKGADSTDISVAEGNSQPSEPGLKRTLGVVDAVLLILSSVVGVGIFLTPREIASHISNPYWFLALWVLGGVIALSGAMSSAALGILMPRAGGDYVFLKNSFGRSWGFLYGYLAFVFSFTGSIATLATGVVQYQGHTIFGDRLDIILFEIPALAYQFKLEQVLAVAIVLFFTMVNHYGTRKSLNLQKIITMTPIFFLIVAGLVIVANVFWGADDSTSKTYLMSNFQGYAFSDVPSLGAISKAMIPIFFTYCGWNAALYLSEDIKEPRKIIPRALSIGVIAVIGIYILFCTVLLSTIPYDILGDKSRSLDIASAAWSFLFGRQAQIVMACLIAVLVLGSLNSTIIGGSRIYFAMARDKLFFSRASRIHPEYGTPSWSLWAQAAWACMIILLFRKFETILEFTTIIIIFLSIMTISSIFVLQRKNRKNEKRKVIEMESHSPEDNTSVEIPGKRLFWYPFMPIFYIVSTAFLLISYLVTDEANREKGLWGFLIVVLGFLIYAIWTRYSRYLNDRNKQK